MLQMCEMICLMSAFFSLTFFIIKSKLCFKCSLMPDSCEYIKCYFVVAQAINMQCFRSEK